MSQLTAKRTKIIRQISKQYKQKYFLERRDKLLKFIEEDQLQDRESEEESRLHQLIKKSLVKNEVLNQANSHSIFGLLRDSFVEGKGIREVEYAMVICSNILIDDLGLDQKETVVALCMKGLTLPVFKNQMKSMNLSLMTTLVKLLLSLGDTLNFIDQDLALSCQQIMTLLLLQLFELMANLILGRPFSDNSKIQEHIQTICCQLMNISQQLLSIDPDNTMNIKFKFKRNMGTFRQILDIHYHLLKQSKVETQNLINLHVGLLNIYSVLSQFIQMIEYPCFFEYSSFIFIIVGEIAVNRSDICSKMALNILTNLLKQYQAQHQAGTISLLLISTCQIHDKQRFFRNIILNDGNYEQRLTLLKLFLSDPDTYQPFIDIFQKCWYQILDYCSFALNNWPQIYTIAQAAITTLICCCDIECNNYTPINHLTSSGVQSLLEYLTTEWQQMGDEFSKLSQYASYLLAKTKQLEYV